MYRCLYINTYWCTPQCTAVFVAPTFSTTSFSPLKKIITFSHMRCKLELEICFRFILKIIEITFLFSCTMKKDLIFSRENNYEI